ncbi:DEAD/DEAH box helicase [Ktedonobacter sp. SOSP1-85]|uniref:type I restriction endonuclease subunit R n=1 Tax=Ktedonobacter sp. SOSP1-85 TaxID=2778367 RepID=UPI0019169A84|nr:type I restriction endonuclease subunit R [Ktedonobacter sp. SOSP1-85]GHO76587.1 DEAD/DEAH box helicase [Ktedonobacter sp. SOSP1-85]
MTHVTEDQLERAALGWFRTLGYQVVFGPDIAPPPDGVGPERDNYRQTILMERLKTRLQAINPAIPVVAIDDAIRQILVPNLPTVIQVNRQLHRWLRDGVKVQYQRDNETVGDQVYLLDFSEPTKNDWLVVNQFSIQGPQRTRRPDIIVFLNGLPVAVLELKNPADEEADIWKAFDQLQTYKEQIPDLFNTNEVLIISDGVTARMGSLTADKERFSTWRTIDGRSNDPLGPMRELETLIKGVFNKEFFLDYLRNYILFEEDKEGIIKKIAGYHQFHAVRSAMTRTLAAAAIDGDHKAGVVWHTQGSGKSISMACYAGKVMTGPEMKNPTIVVVTDRNDLDGQLFGTFSMAKDLLRETPVQADNRKGLRELLENRPSGGIIFTTIQKFTPGEDEDSFPVLSERHNIVVICDEAHRTQYGLEARLNKKGEYEYGYAKHMRDGLPNATFIAFTGTPVSQTDRDTRAVFGPDIHVYDMEQAEKDQATVKIYYEGRLAKLELNNNENLRIDEEFDELTEDQEESAAAKTRSRWAALEKLVGTEPRIKQIAADLVQHFEARLRVIDGKAMVVAMSREICAHLFNAIVDLRPEWHDDDPKRGVIKIVMTGSSSDKAILRPHLYSKQVKKDLEQRYKDPADPFKIVIVRDMWLTGFDAPCLHSMYVDKPMRGHTLMQAIARVNRVFRDKPGGLVVDYIGIANELREALNEYTASGGKGEPTEVIEKAFGVFLEKLSIARGMMHGFDYDDYETEAFELLPGAADHVLSQKDGQKRFADCVTGMTRAFALCSTYEDAIPYREEVAFLQAIKAVITKHSTASSKLDDEQREHALRQIVSKAIAADGVVDIFAAAGLKNPNIGLLSDEFLNDVRLLPHKNLAVALLERLLKNDIKSRFQNNVVQNKKFTDLLQQSLNNYRNRAIETAQVIEELIAMAQEFRAAAERGEDLGLSADEIAFYDALETNQAAVRELGDDILRKIAAELTDRLRKNISVDWSVRETVRAKLRLLVKRILRKYKYPPDLEQRAIDLVLQQAETLSETWV